MEYVNLDTLVWFQEGPGVRNYQYVDKGIKLINVTNLVNGQLKLHLTSRYISEEEAFGKYKHFLCDNGDLVIASSGITYETLSKKIAFVTEKDLPLCMNTSVIRFKPLNHDVCIDYIYYFFKSEKYRNQISKLMTGSAQLNYGPSHLHKVKIPYYDIVRQTKIADELKKIDENISICYRNIENLDNIVKSQFIEMFGEIIESRDRECTFEEICNNMIGLTYNPGNVSDEGTIVLRSGNIKDGELQIESDVVRVSNVKIKDEKFVRDKDILMCSRNGSARLVGKTCIIHKPKEEMTFGAFMTIIRTKYPYILNTFMNMDYFRNQLTSTQTASVNQITTKMLNGYKIFKPTKEEENKFSDFVQQIDKSKFIVQKQIKLLEELLEKKMNEYFGQ